jgi:hypothetical protein
VSGSTVPAALDALTVTFTGALPDLQVVDGPDYDPRRNFLAVGWHSNDEPAAVVDYLIADAGRARDQEQYDVHCLLSFHVGTGTVSSARASLYTAYEALARALADNPKLGGAVSRARMANAEYLPLIDEGGVTVSIRFSVNVLAWK